MKLIDGIKLIGKPAEISGCSRIELPEFFKQMGYKVGAEIGVYKGEFTERFCKEGIKMFAVDPWTAYYGDKDQVRQDLIYDGVCKKLIMQDCTIVRKSSAEAAGQFCDGELDFVYIDSDHRFKETAADIVDWERKVRSGGVVSGHDYFTSLPHARRFRCQVGAIVDAYTKAFGIENFFVFGELDRETEPNVGEWYLSWMWIKP
jgi:hypothetical protein